MADEAEQYLSRATDRAPAPLMYFGLSEFRLRRLDTAEVAAKRSIELKSRDEFRDYYLALGMVLAAQGDSTGALQAFEREARENPDPQDALDQIDQLRAR